jgi:ATP-binding cassette subfamily B protein
MSDTLVFNFLNTFFQIIIIILSLIYLDWFSAILIFGVVVAFLGYSFYIQRLQEPANLEYNKKEDIEKANISDVFTNIDSIKYFGKEKFIETRYKKLSEDTRKIELKQWDYFNWMSGGQVLILSIGTFFVVFFPLMSFLHKGISIGTLTYIYTVYLSLTGGMYNLIQGVRGFYRSMADFQDLFEYNKVEKEIKDRPGAKDLKVLRGEVFFNNITFKYGEKLLFGLRNFNLKIKPGEKVAIVGHSGSGKTTLIKLLYRFYDIDSGEIDLDGEDIRNVKQESLRSELSIVPQECVLFDDTIFNNIRFSNPDASRKQVMDAIRFAQLDYFVNNLPKRENTIVGERGVKLSGGERQRVSIARAILANKKILVLDEATSSLDSETEHEIQKKLHKLLEGRTSIIIAHRLSTIMSADRIIVMKNGKIIQEGTHNKLINSYGEYKKLWDLQKGGYIGE